jgi:uncharacterized protein
VEASDPYGIAKDMYNRVRFKPVKTSGLRLEVKLRPAMSAGIEQWKVK